MFLKKLKSLLVFALVLLLTCSFTVLVNAEDNSEVTSAVSEVSETQSEAQSEAESAAVSDVSSEANSDESSAVGEESTESDASEAGTTSNTPGWLGWAIAGGVIIIIALCIFILIKKNTPIGQKIVKFFKDYKSEIRKVVWLSKEDLLKKTIVVLVTIIISCIVLGLLDYAFTSLVSLIK